MVTPLCECCVFSRNLAEYEHQSNNFSRPARNSSEKRIRHSFMLCQYAKRSDAHKAGLVHILPDVSNIVRCKLNNADNV